MASFEDVLNNFLGAITTYPPPVMTKEQDVELTTLFRTLPMLVECGRAKSTVTKYKAGWQGWLTWGAQKRFPTRPANHYYVALYLTHLFLLKNKKGPITSAMYGIRWGHHIVGLSSPTDNPLVQLTYEGCIRSCAQKRQKKEPISIDIIKRLVDRFYRPDTGLMDYRFLILSLLSFAGF